MTPQHLVAIIARLAAIWLTLVASEALVNARYLPQIPGESVNWLAYLGPVIAIVAALLLWRFPLQLARTLLPPRRDDIGSRIEPRAAAAAGCVIIGALAMLQALPGVTTFFGVMIFDYSDQLGDALAANKLEQLRSGVQLVCGILLIAKANAIAATIARTGQTKVAKPLPVTEDNTDS